MNRTKNILLIYFILLLMVAGIIFVIVFINTPLPNDPQDGVIVSHKRPDSFSPVEAISYEDTTPQQAPTATATALPTAEVATPETADQWTLMIQDPLGDPIPAGIIAFGSESASFTEGCFMVPETAPRELTIQVSADGYTPGEFTVTPNSSPLVLDYFCDFSIQVVDERGAPVPKTTIRVWKSNPPPRPVGDQATVYTNHRDFLGNAIHLVRNEWDCQVTWVDKPRYSFDTYGSHDGEVFPKTGDLLMALGTCTWHPVHTPFYINLGYKAQRAASILGEFLPLTSLHSGRLRIWDTLCSAEQAKSSRANINPQVLEILRDGKRWFYYQIFPECPENQPFLLEGKSNDKGEWALRGVPPALYYVQATDGQNRYSGILPLHPACGGARLRLSGAGILQVFVEKEGIPAKDKLFARVPDAEVILHSQRGIKVYAKKSDYDGEARFENLPYGEYRLIAKAQGQTAEKIITFNKPIDTCHVTLPHEELYKITGIVLEQDSGAPVAGYALELNTDNRTGYFGYHVYQEVISDENGRFEFHDVIPGKYCVSDDFKSLGEFNYIFSDPSTNYGTLLESYTHLSNINLNVYEHIHDLKILVKPVVKTNFSGIVMDQKGIPVMNAVFTVVPRLVRGIVSQRAKLHPMDFKTDSSGLFSLTIFNDYRSEGQRYNFEITAMTGSMAPSRWVPIIDNPMKFDFVEEKFHATSTGSVTMKGDMGDTFEGLRIVLEPQVSDKTLYGKLVAEGEDKFSLVDINATQKNQDVFIQLNKEGYFKAENISAGDMTLIINPEIRDSIATPNGSHEYYKYISRTVTILIEDGYPKTYVEIPLQRSGYYWGYVKDSAGIPVPGVAVWAEDRPSLNGHAFVATDQNGFFFLGYLGSVEGKRYNIKYDVAGQVKVMPDVPPNTGNLLLQ